MTEIIEFGRASEVENNDRLSFYRGYISTVVVVTKIENRGREQAWMGRR